MDSSEIVALDQELGSPAARIPFFPLAVRRANGCILEDQEGHEYLDFLSAACVVNVGHNHPQVVRAIQQQAAELIHYNPAYVFHQPMVQLAQELCRISPGSHAKRVAYGLSGGDANDAAIKIARSYTGRQKIVGFLRSYHGATYGALSLSAVSLNMRRKFGPLLPEVYHLPYPDCYRCQFGKRDGACNLECWKYAETVFQNQVPAEEVAAVVLEAIQGDSGILIPPQAYLDRLAGFCRDNGILLVSEEVQSGFGRTGQWFAIEQFGIVPDLVIMGKAIASGMPLSAVVGRKEVLEGWGFPGHCLSTAANPVSCAASLATIRVLEEEHLLQRAAESGRYLADAFWQMAKVHPLIGDVRGIGLMLGVDLVQDKDTRARALKETAKVVWRLYQMGVFMTFFSGSVLRIAPPLTVSKSEMDRALTSIDQALGEVERGAVGDEVLATVKGW